MRLRVAILSVHTCPLAALGGKETGGMNVYVRATARELGRMGVHVDVFTRSQNPGIRRVVELGTGARVIHLPAGPEAPMAREVVHRHLHEFVDGVEAHRRAEGLEYDLVHGHYWLSGVAGLALRESWGVPLVQMFHTLGRLKSSVAKTPAEVEPEIRLSEEDRIVRLADRVVAANVVERAHLAWYYGASTDRIAVIPCGVDTELFRPMPQVEAKRLLFWEAMTALDGAAQLLIVGGDQDEPENGHADYLRERVSVLGLRERVSFLGAQPQERLRLFYAAADATVMPSYYESFGMVALEAMACGSPVIASRVGGRTTTVRDGVTGFLVPEGDAGALAERVALLLEDRGRRAQLGREAQRWAAEHRWPCVAEAVCRLYSDLRPSASGHLARARCRSSHGSS
ncbi:MAG: glycosyltransferase [Candidatus Rokubacteria bacterium]|nr:glycosyltransferase [Candidatus Rokubacteria bacterium]